MHALIRLLRPHQYIKNGFVLLGLLFATQRDAATAAHAALAFLAFCAMASAVYVLNDLLDVEADRQHPQKCRRPIASGEIKAPLAWCACVLLAGAALALGAAVGLAVPLLLLTYLALNLAYSLYLKHVVILDVFVISAGFMLRILAGTVGIGIVPSQWLLLCGLMVTLFLGFAKRHAELMQLAGFGALYLMMLTNAFGYLLLSREKLGSELARLEVLDAATGVPRWTKPISSDVGVAVDQRFVFTADDQGAVVAFSREGGQSAWKNDALARRRLSTPASFGRSVAVGDYQGYIHFLSREDGALIGRISTDGSPIVAAPVVAGSNLIFQTQSGTVTALAVE